MKSYIQPQAHHWIIARLVRTYDKTNKSNMKYFIDHARSVAWLMSQVGYSQVNEMMDALQLEDNK